MTAICVERGTFTSEAWRREAEGEEELEGRSTEPLFCVGQKVADYTDEKVWRNWCAKENLVQMALILRLPKT